MEECAATIKLNGHNLTLWPKKDLVLLFYVFPPINKWFIFSYWNRNLMIICIISIKRLRRRHPWPDWFKYLLLLWLIWSLVPEWGCVNAALWHQQGEEEDQCVWWDCCQAQQRAECWYPFRRYTVFHLYAEHWQWRVPMQVFGTQSTTCFLLYKVIKCILLVSRVYSVLIKRAWMKTISTRAPENQSWETLVKTALIQKDPLVLIYKRWLG